MRNIFTLPKKKTIASRPVKNNTQQDVLSVASCNKSMAPAGRTTTTYIVTNDNNDISAKDVSFFLMPDPYSPDPDSYRDYRDNAGQQ